VSLVAEGYRLAQGVTRRHAKSFYFASIALFGARRRAAFALYAFCRRLDDLVDEGTASDPRSQLAKARQIISALYRPTAGAAVGWPWSGAELAALADAVQRFEIPEQPLQELVSGMEMDLEPRAYASYGELDLYCHRVAGTVGLMLAPVLGCSSEAALGPAADLGRAMQLTNILRDLAEDLDRGRLYLPRDELAQFGITPTDLRARRVDARFVALMQAQIARARDLYRRADAGVGALAGFGAQRLVRLMGGLYAGILTAIEEQAYDVFRRRAFVPFRTKVAIAARVMLSRGEPR
jgi:phytoene synthase